MKAIGCIVCVIAGMIFRAFVLMKLWAWFVVPFGLPKVGMAWAMGISTLVSLMTYNGTSVQLVDIKKHLGIKETLGKDLVVGLLISAFVLATGWVIKLAM